MGVCVCVSIGSAVDKLNEHAILHINKKQKQQQQSASAAHRYTFVQCVQSYWICANEHVIKKPIEFWGLDCVDIFFGQISLSAWSLVVVVIIDFCVRCV